MSATIEEKRRARESQKWIIEYLLSDLYGRVPLSDGGNRDTDGEFASPLNWRVRLTRPDMAGGPAQIDAVIFRPNGEVFWRGENVEVEDIRAVLP